MRFRMDALPVVLAAMIATMPTSVFGQQTGEEAEAQIHINNVRIFDGKSEQLAEGKSVLVVGNKIQTISSSRILADKGATVIDGRGRVLMPGLIDGHSHLNISADLGTLESGMTWDEIAARSVYMAKAWLMDGFTTVRDLGGMGSGLKKTVDAGLVEGPRIYPSGAFLTQTSGHGDFRSLADRNPILTGHHDAQLDRLGIFVIADGKEKVLAAARQNLMRGASQIKIMAGGGVASQHDPVHVFQFTPQEIKVAVDAAADWDTYVAAHVFTAEGIRRCLEAGVMSIDHGYFIDEPTARLLKEKGAFLVTNMTALSPESANNPFLANEASLRKLAIARELMKDYVEVVKKVRPKMVFQTDAVGFPQDIEKHRAYEKWYHAELFGNLEMLKAATSVAGELLALTGRNNPYPGKLGVIEEGALADLLIVDGNPLEDITVVGANPKWYDAKPRDGVETILLIMKGGKIYKNTLASAIR